MEIVVKMGIVGIWLTNADQDDNLCKALLPSIIKELSNGGFLPVVYRSGKEPLYAETLALLRRNRDRKREL